MCKRPVIQLRHVREVSDEMIKKVKVKDIAMIMVVMKGLIETGFQSIVKNIKEQLKI